MSEVRYCDIDEKSLTCRLCGAQFFNTNTLSACKPPRGLGDMVKAGLSAIGITEERVKAIVGGDCGCDQRQEALNEFGRFFGMG